MLFETFIFAIVFNVLMFIPAFIFKTDKLTDLSYSLTFIALAVYVFLSKPYSLGTLFLFLMILLWALRLGSFLFIRIHQQKKDDRFDSMRHSFFRFLTFWLFQGLTVWVVLLPFFLFEGTYQIFGFIIWLIGLIIESVADHQKLIFKKDSKNKGKFIQTGLWKYSRHPNYFGEIVCWIGIYVFSGVWIWGLFSPLYIILILVFFSGVPLLEQKAEKKWRKDKEYQLYKNQTSLLIPWFK